MSKKLLELVMIVKNSGDVLRKCLQSVKPYIDTWTIVDTGSTDHTPSIIEEEMKEIDGVLHHIPFVDFSTTRNKSLDLCSGKCKYLLILDDSYELKGGAELRELLDTSSTSSFSLKIGNIRETLLQSCYYSLRIIKTDSNLRYKGRVHEYIVDPSNEMIQNELIYINDIENNAHVMRSKARAKSDIAFLMKDYSDHPTHPRTLMYLAKTHILIGGSDHTKKALSFLNKMIDLGENIHREYQFFAHYEKTCLSFEEDGNRDVYIKNLIKIQSKFQDRAEPFYKLAVIKYEEGKYREVASMMDKLLFFPTPILMMTLNETMIYDYYIPYLYIDVNMKLRNFTKAIEVLRLKLEHYPSDQSLLNIKYAVCDNSGYSPEKLSNKTLVIHTGQIGMYWNPKSTNISGSEQAAMAMATEMQKLGYRSFIFGQFEDYENNINYQGTYNGVQYIDCHYFQEFAMKYFIDYLIVSRFVENLVYYDNIKNVYLWVHDIYPRVGKNAPAFQIHYGKFKGMIVVSEWQYNLIHKKLAIPERMLLLSRNAIYAERFIENIEKVEKIPYRFIYTADSTRGLSNLINMIVPIKNRYPETTLVLYTRLEMIDNEMMNVISKLDYVQLNKRTDQKTLSLEFMKSDVWLYPTEFEETYCISALEAMASGCLVASVKLAGLINTIGSRGILGKHPISSIENQTELLNKLYYVLDRPDIKSRYTENAKEWALTQTYERLAKEWNDNFFK